MSSPPVNDENQGTLPTHKHVPCDSVADIFALDHPSGRPSILRPSQAVNVNKTIPKGVKVCFQTPLRDPVTKKIVSPSCVEKMATPDDCVTVVESLTFDTSTLQSYVPAKDSSLFPDDDMPIQSRGGYTIDFDNLDSMNPFQSSAKTIHPNFSPLKPAAPLSDIQTEPVPPASSPAPEVVEKVIETPETALDETLPFVTSVENSLADFSSDSTSADSAVVIELRKTESSPVVNEDASESPLVPKGSSQIDNLDSLNPFSTGGSNIQNSPVSMKSQVPEAEVMSSRAKNIQTPIEQEAEPSSAKQPSLTEVNTDVSSTSSVTPPKEAPLVLEFNFDDGKVKSKPPPRSLGLKRPPRSKIETDAVKPVSAPAKKKSPEVKLESCDSSVMEIPPARGAYTIDFDRFDDPNFNPFGTKAKTETSPHRNGPVVKEVSESPAKPENPKHGSLPPEPEQATGTKKELESLPVAETHQPCVEAIMKLGVMEPVPPSTLSQSAAADEEFVHGAMFMPNDLEGQIDYLEQFGSSTFKESALRKQSLYLKFDPLLKESPKKAVADSGFCLPRPSLAIRMMEAARSGVRQKSQQEKQESTKLLEDFLLSEEPPVVQNLTVLVPSQNETQRSEDVIVDVLKYTQKDLDDALETARKQAEEREAELKAQVKKLSQNNQNLMLMALGFEEFALQTAAEHKRKEELTQAELSKVLQDKQQLAKELSDLERSFFDVVKRLDSRKEVIESFRKNEETLKQCAQNYLSRLQMEEKRYQALKADTKETISQANKKIAEVRAKMGTDISALQAQLRREQLKVQFLEKNLEQKTKEADDVTKLFDDLIGKVHQY